MNKERVKLLEQFIEEGPESFLSGQHFLSHIQAFSFHTRILFLTYTLRLSL